MGQTEAFLRAKHKPEYIICAAIHYHDTEVFEAQPKNIKNGFVLAGWRHFNILPIATRLGRRTVNNHTQGFLTSKGRFVDREEGRQIAFKTGQVDYLGNDGRIKDLFSEDIY